MFWNIIRKMKDQYSSLVFTNMFLLPLWNLKERLAIVYRIIKAFCAKPMKFI